MPCFSEAKNLNCVNEIERAVTEAKAYKQWRQEYMTLLEQFEREREEGRAEERENTERERRRADAAEAKIKELEKLLSE